MIATKEKIEEWKKAHKNVYQVTVDNKTCYLRKPSRQELSYATTLVMKNPIKYQEALLNACWLDGDSEMKTDDDLFYAVSQKIAEITEIKEAELKKL